MWFRLALVALCLALTPPAAAQERVLELTQGSLVRDAMGMWLTAPGIGAPAVLRPLPVLGPKDTSREAQQLRGLVRRGVSGGLAGVIYENRDRGHSNLPPDLFPQITRLRYGPDLVAQGMDYGLAGAMILPGITIGNSSTVATGHIIARSLPRFAMTDPAAPDRMAAIAAANMIYVYPEHRDHDDTDLYPANWPYMFISQGSSYSDQPILRAVAMILAALPAETRALAEAEGLVAPTVQMIFRRGRVAEDAYLTGAAHPTVFDGADLDVGRMITLAADLAPGDLPPAVLLTALAEDFSRSAGLAGQSERLFDTPQAIARIWRDPAFTREMTVTAARTRDPNGRPLRFHWVVLRGDPARVRITPFDAQGITARLAFDWHDPRLSAPAGATPGERVDIGVFADNGVQLSAPAFVTVSLPQHHLRVYEPLASGGARLVSIDYDATARQAPFDPVLHWSAYWRDAFQHDASGQITGWTRVTTNPHFAGAAGAYLADGRRDDGRAVTYILRGPGKPLTLSPGGPPP